MIFIKFDWINSYAMNEYCKKVIFVCQASNLQESCVFDDLIDDLNFNHFDLGVIWYSRVTRENCLVTSYGSMNNDINKLIYFLEKWHVSIGRHNHMIYFYSNVTLRYSGSKLYTRFIHDWDEISDED